MKFLKSILTKVTLLCILAAAIGAVTTAEAANVEKIIKKVQKKYRSTKTIRIEFKEMATFQLTGMTTEVSATLQMEGKEKFRLESEDQVLVNNGTTMWRFNKLDSQVLVDDAKKDQQDAMLNSLLYEINDHYFSELIEEKKENGVKKYSIKLTPKPSEQSYFTSIKILVRDKSWEIEQLTYTDYNGNETEYAIEKIDFNPGFNDAVFSFVPPEGIQVIDLRY